MSNTTFSIDGRSFTCEGPLATSPVIGGYVIVETGDGRRLLGQALSTALGTPTSDPGLRLVVTTGEFVAEIVDDEPRPIGSLRGFTTGHLESADTTTIERHIDASIGSSAALDIGEIRTAPGVRALLKASGFGRHTFLCGQSGSGKTYTLGLILERLLLDTDIRIAVIDPNSDYVALGNLLDESSTGLTHDEHARLAERFAAVAEGIHVAGEGHEVPLRAWFGRLGIDQQAMVLGLDPAGDAGEFHALLRATEQLEGDYSLDDLVETAHRSLDEDARRLVRRVGNLGVAGLSIWAATDRPGLRDVLPDDWRMAVADIGSLPSRREASIASASLLELAWERRRERRPIVLVIDEAHNVCPQHPMDAHQALATENVVRIAAEGRKYGLYLLLSTQRPDKVHQQVLSQCDNLVVMKMNSASDIAVLADTFSFAPAALIEQAPTFGLGEGLAAGKIAPDPLPFRTGRRYTEEGGSDVPATWARRR